ncbi:Uncharacterized protein TCM_044496 [Theobroma cacao]|uniref:Prolamin-like domain-containing protein n=1 Tax=Theobroma cacao TaxID=3641 RepID=A0A061FRV9_THECC|nr:Uncharacterized protein TCM_044496 [Theobroma cacao]
MASFKVLGLMMILFVTSGVVMSIEEVVDPIQAYNCETKMSLNCVMEVFESICNKAKSVTDKCCGELMVLGQVCHNALLKRTLQLPKFKNVDASILLKRSIQTWNKCAFVVDGVAPSPSL